MRIILQYLIMVHGFTRATNILNENVILLFVPRIGRAIRPNDDRRDQATALPLYCDNDNPLRWLTVGLFLASGNCFCLPGTGFMNFLRPGSSPYRIRVWRHHYDQKIAFSRHVAALTSSSMSLGSALEGADPNHFSEQITAAECSFDRRSMLGNKRVTENQATAGPVQAWS
jgi:hypothetical protein